jgi:hypothetical protein
MLSIKDKVAIVTGADRSARVGQQQGDHNAWRARRIGPGGHQRGGSQQTRQIIEGEGGTCAVHCCDMLVAAGGRWRRPADASNASTFW